MPVPSMTLPLRSGVDRFVATYVYPSLRTQNGDDGDDGD